MTEAVSMAISSLKSNLFLKVISSIITGSLLYLIGSENIKAFSAVGVLCIIDTIMALYVAYKKGNRITSKKLPRKMVTLSIYALIVGAMNMMVNINPSLSLLVDMAITYVGATEALSILENAGELGYKIPVTILKDLSKSSENG